MSFDNLGDRMKRYEAAARTTLPFTAAELREQLRWDESERCFAHWGDRKIVVPGAPDAADRLRFVPIGFDDMIIVKGSFVAAKPKQIVTEWEVE